MLIRKIRVLERTPDGDYEVTEVIEPSRKKKKKITPLLKPIERSLRRRAKAREKFAETYLERHRRSNEKRRNGFIRDLWRNIFRASAKARKELRR